MVLTPAQRLVIRLMDIGPTRVARRVRPGLADIRAADGLAKRGLIRYRRVPYPHATKRTKHLIGSLTDTGELAAELIAQQRAEWAQDDWGP